MPRIVSHDEWVAARTALLVKEKEATKQRDRLNVERRELPMVEVKRMSSAVPSARCHCLTCRLRPAFESRVQPNRRSSMDENEQRLPCTAIPGVPIPPSALVEENTMAERLLTQESRGEGSE